MEYSSGRQKARVEREAAHCAGMMFLEITGGQPLADAWYRWFLCERHGGQPLIDPHMPAGQVAYWDGEDIVIDGRATIAELAAALPEELAHRLTSPETPRFEPMNYILRCAQDVGRAEFQEMVGQRVAALFEAALPGSIYPDTLEEEISRLLPCSQDDV